MRNQEILCVAAIDVIYMDARGISRSIGPTRAGLLLAHAPDRQLLLPRYFVKAPKITWSLTAYGNPARWWVPGLVRAPYARSAPRRGRDHAKSYRHVGCACGNDGAVG